MNFLNSVASDLISRDNEHRTEHRSGRQWGVIRRPRRGHIATNELAEGDRRQSRISFQDLAAPPTVRPANFWNWRSSIATTQRGKLERLRAVWTLGTAPLQP